MSRLLKHLVSQWQDRAAVRAEQTLEPTLHRRLDRAAQRWADRRVLRQERRARCKTPAEIDEAIIRTWGKAVHGRRD
jgi:hypothetical protein